MTTVSEPPKTDFRVVGTRPIRHDGVDKVTGRARYGADIDMPGLIHGKVLRSPHPHARIRSIDTSKAEALPGVRAVVTATDFPILEDQPINYAEIRGSARMLAENVMARKKALYAGHAVAAVAADSPHEAEEALAHIEVDYELLPTVLTLDEALKDDAPLLHEGLTTRSISAFLAKDGDTGKPSNISFHIQFKDGDLDAGFAEADIVIEREYTTQSVHQGYIEPHASTAWWAPDGQITVWTSTQGAFSIRSETALILGLPEGRVKVIPMEIGGGFGGKLDTYLDPVAAELSRKSGRPVKIVMSRREVFEGSGPTSAAKIIVKLGAKSSGKITAAHVQQYYESGAFPGSPVGEGAMTGLAPYAIENITVDGYDVVCNKQKVAAYRAPGAPIAAFGVESAMDELAAALGLDPIDLREANLAQPGDRMPSGKPHEDFAGNELLTAIKTHPAYTAPLGPNQGRGVAVGYWFNATMQSSATINVNSDGTISLLTGSVDIGGTRAAVAMQAAEVLGLDAGDVRPTVVDTDSIGWTGTTGGSRTAVDTGRAAIEAAEMVKKELAARAATMWEVSPSDVVFEAGVFINTKSDERIAFKDLAAQQMALGGTISVSATTKGRKAAPAFAGHVADVEVDPETGKVHILRYTAFQDAGRAAHPSYVEGQMQGGAVQGIGWALNEEYYFSKDGRLANSSFLDYRMPTALDVPRIDTVMLEIPGDAHPFGMRGVGEVPIVPPMATIANAVSAATGVRMANLPITPGSIVKALADAKPD